jgi:competence protein ComFB
MSDAGAERPSGRMTNLIEESLEEHYAQLKGKVAGFCGCAQCKDDVLTMALNQIRPRYTSGARRGSVITRAELQLDQARAEVMVVMLDALRKVAAAPRHVPKG